MDSHPARPATILVVDDSRTTRAMIVSRLRALGYRTVEAADGQAGLDGIAEHAPDLVLTDLVMPRMSGSEMVRRLKDDRRTRLTPIVMLTNLDDLGTRVAALEAGADDVLTKPVAMEELQARLHNLLRLKACIDELESAECMLLTLAEIVEAKDPHVGRHCERLAAFGAILGSALSVSEDEVKALRLGGALHDIGKIAIPDRILLKRGPLAPSEWVTMRQHPIIGERLCRPMKSLRLVLPVIRSHHEHWDGTGYPDGLAGEAIPFLARILQVVDAYDALRSRRPYKPALPCEKAYSILEQEARAGKWDPRVTRALGTVLPSFDAMEETYAQDAEDQETAQAGLREGVCGPAIWVHDSLPAAGELATSGRREA